MTINPISVIAAPAATVVKQDFASVPIVPPSNKAVSTAVTEFPAVPPEIPDPVERTIKRLMDGVNRFCHSSHRFHKGLEYALATLDRAQQLEEKRSSHMAYQQRSITGKFPVTEQSNIFKLNTPKKEVTP